MRCSMLGIWAAVKPTTSYCGASRKTVLKLWKSRPAAPRMRTRRRGRPLSVSAILASSLPPRSLAAGGAGGRVAFRRLLELAQAPLGAEVVATLAVEQRRGGARLLPP